MSFLLPAERWQGTGETGASICHVIWRLLPLTQALSVSLSSGYTEMSGWHEPAVFCIAACIFNVVWQLCPELNILVFSENHSKKTKQIKGSPMAFYSVAGEIWGWLFNRWPEGRREPDRTQITEHETVIVRSTGLLGISATRQRERQNSWIVEKLPLG